MSQDLLARIALLERQVEQLQNITSLRGADVQAASAPHTTSEAELAQALAPLNALLADDSINDILINNPNDIFVERMGKLEKTNLTLPSDASVFAMAQAIGHGVGRAVSVHKPLLDARLPDGSRVNVVAHPLALDGTAISIRKFARRTITLEDMAQWGNTSPSLSEFLKVVARCRLNVLISGGTGSGKTTLLNAMAQHIDPAERIVTIEDAAELRLSQPDIVRLETRPMRVDRRDDEVSIRDLVRNALRMRPDRILVGEVRGPEAFDMMQAMNTGHEGSLTTIHANHPRDALSRLENMIMTANLNLPMNSIRAQIASAINLVVQVSRMRDGHRRIAFVSEVVGMEGDVITMQDLFTFQPKGEGDDGKLLGEFKWTGIMPRFLRRVAYYGEADRLAAALGTEKPKK